MKPFLLMHHTQQTYLVTCPYQSPAVGRETSEILFWWRGNKESLLCLSIWCSNRPFPSSLVPLFQSESKCETILRKMTLICMKMKLHAELIFIWKVSHLDSLWNGGTRELGNGLLNKFPLWNHLEYILMKIWHGISTLINCVKRSLP